MAKYIKYYYVDDENNTFCCELEEPRYKRHPWKEYDGLDVKIWLTDSDGVDSMLAEIPDSTIVVDIIHECGKKSVQVLTDPEYNSISIPYFESQTLYREAQLAEEVGDEDLYLTKQKLADLKYNEALTIFHSL